MFWHKGDLFYVIFKGKECRGENEGVGLIWDRGEVFIWDLNSLTKSNPTYPLMMPGMRSYMGVKAHKYFFEKALVGFCAL